MQMKNAAKKLQDEPERWICLNQSGTLETMTCRSLTATMSHIWMIELNDDEWYFICMNNCSQIDKS